MIIIYIVVSCTTLALYTAETVILLGMDGYSNRLRFGLLATVLIAPASILLLLQPEEVTDGTEPYFLLCSQTWHVLLVGGSRSFWKVFVVRTAKLSIAKMLCATAFVAAACGLLNAAIRIGGDEDMLSAFLSLTIANTAVSAAFFPIVANPAFGCWVVIALPFIAVLWEMVAIAVFPPFVAEVSPGLFAYAGLQIAFLRGFCISLRKFDQARLEATSHPTTNKEAGVS